MTALARAGRAAVLVLAGHAACGAEPSARGGSPDLVSHDASGAPVVVALANALRDHSSPYLALHGDDPVAWQDWGPDAFAAARAHRRLILVSVGYFACHWCHVMQRESYRDPDIAAQLNADFIAIKVDRERHPGIDARLIDFAERTVGRAGWPLNVFLTPDGYPLVATLYEPPERFAAFLSRLSARWRAEPDALHALARRAAEAARNDAHRDAPAPSESRGTPRDLAKLRARLHTAALEYADVLSGGFGQQAKFPMAPQLMALLMDVRRGEANDELREFLDTTFTRMAALGLRDHLHGGFFRYTVDPDWHTPHFEKMLYDNAQLAELYVHAADVLDRPDYRQVAFDTLDFVMTHLAAGSGGYISSLSALDAEGHEGGDYLWRRDHLRALLDAETLPLMARVWGLSHPLPPGDDVLPRLTRSPEEAGAALGLDPDTARSRHEEALRALRRARGEYRPPRDDKVIAAWNGLLLRALVAAARAPGGARFGPAADRLAGFLRTAFQGPEGLTRIAARARPPATLEDHVFLASGLQAWAAWRNDAGAMRQAATWHERAREHFRDVTGWRRDRDQLLRYGGAHEALADDALPSPSAEWERVATALRGTAPAALTPAERADPFAHASRISPFIDAIITPAVDPVTAR